MPALPASAPRLGVAAVLLLGAIASARQAAAPPATDIYLAPIRLLPAPAMGPARVATENPGGYDNQPFFGADGRAMLFTSRRDGKQTDIYFLEIQTRQIRQLTRTPESEYSPTVMPGEAGVSVIKVEADGTQRVWTIGDGDTPGTVVARDVKPAGYHAWADDGRLAIYLLGTPATLQVVDPKSGRTTTIASDVGRSLQRRPTGTLSFVQRMGDRWMVREWVPASGEVRDLVPAVEGSTDRDTAWAADGTLFMTAGESVYWWRPGQSDWTLLSEPGVGPLSRLAVSPDGRWMALVVAEAPR